MFLIIYGDKPIFEMDLVPGQKHIKQYFLIHSSLDTIDMMVKSKRDYYLGQVKNDDLTLFAYVNAIQIKFLLVIGKKEIDKSVQKNIKEFFMKMNEALALAFLNPLYQPKSYIKSAIFEEKVKTARNQSLRAFLLQKKK